MQRGLARYAESDCFVSPHSPQEINTATMVPVRRVVCVVRCVMPRSQYAPQRARRIVSRLVDVLLFGGVVLPLLVIGAFLLL
jgi:hypothetical protein